MRLHACIFGIDGGRPVMALSYDSKVRKQMRHFRMEEFTLQLDQVGAAAKLLDELLALPPERMDEVQSILNADKLHFHELARRIFPGAPGRPDAGDGPDGDLRSRERVKRAR